MELRLDRQMTGRRGRGPVFRGRLFSGALLSILFLAPAPSSGQTSPHFYNVATEIRVEGIVQDIRFEPRYEGAAAFLILALEERTTKRRFQVEISPAWFFERDIHKGEPMKILGSLASSEGQTSILIAREVQVQGETINVRDARGFPNWRGGPMHRGRRKRGG